MLILVANWNNRILSKSILKTQNRISRIDIDRFKKKKNPLKNNNKQAKKNHSTKKSTDTRYTGVLTLNGMKSLTMKNSQLSRFPSGELKNIQKTHIYRQLPLPSRNLTQDEAYCVIEKQSIQAKMKQQREREI